MYCKTINCDICDWFLHMRLQHLGGGVPESGGIQEEGVLHCSCSAIGDEELYSV